MTAERVAQALYRALLNREPDTELEQAPVAGYLAGSDDVTGQIRNFLGSVESRTDYLRNPAFRAIVAPEPSPAGTPVIVFLHVPKTAGSSLREMLASHFALEERCGDVTFSEFRRYTLARIASFRLVSGHFGPLPLHLFGDRPVVSVTLLRDPVRLVPSLYGQLRRHGSFGHRPVDLARALPFAEWVRHEDTRGWWSDFQARMLAIPREVPAWTDQLSFGDGDPRLDVEPDELAARAHALLDQVGVVGADHQVLAVYHEVCRRAGLTPNYAESPRVNIGQGPKADELDDATREHLLAANQLDAALLELVSKRGAAYPVPEPPTADPSQPATRAS